jgi:ACR3 family arsenite efflux pump ArsB
MLIKKKLYVFVIIDMILALVMGSIIDFSSINIKPISMIAVFIMLYPMLTGLAVEKVKKAGSNYKLIISTLFFAYVVASFSAYIISRTVLSEYPNIAFAMVMVGAIPCSNMLIGWSGIADASVEDALVIAVIGLLMIPVISPAILMISGGVFVSFSVQKLFYTLLTFILVPLILGFFTRKLIIDKKGKQYFIEIKKVFPGISATGILVIVFFSVAKVAREVIASPEIFLVILTGLVIYYVFQTVISIFASKLFKFKYEQAMILILGATASSQAISLSVAASMFSDMTVFALSFKPAIQVLYIMLLIYGMGPRLKKLLR